MYKYIGTQLSIYKKTTQPCITGPYEISIDMFSQTFVIFRKISRKKSTKFRMCRSLKRPCIETIHSQSQRGPRGFAPHLSSTNIVKNHVFFLKFRFFRQKQGDFVSQDFPNFDFFTSKIGFERFLISCLAIVWNSTKVTTF